ncbi:MAG: fatty acid--CoA ligase [Devosia sp.]|uniref:class I adenylate-forming enzyme family protein n=1 Tax=Devosia sp. TaxID=1871048 RepID=UPI00260DE9AD|nr:class I adenylate-forming enzyme family protein [Devosia sp.]MDB5541868.1 fatty acid--CoA ligase [Devosia sp.]
MADETSSTPAVVAGGWPVISLAQAHAQLTAPGAPFEIVQREIRGVLTRTWKNAPPTLRDLFVGALRFRAREFLIYEDDRATYDSFAKAAITLAHRLQDDGVRKGDRVAIIMRNLPEWPVCFWAAVLAGATVTPLNAWWTSSELEYGLTDCGAKIALVDGERFEANAEMLEGLAGLERVYVARFPDSGAEISAKARGLESVIGAVKVWCDLPQRPMPDVSFDPEDDATILYTSGTTGKPKGALGTHRNFTSNITTLEISAARTRLRAGEPLPEVDPMDAPQAVALLVVPLFHATGLSATLGPIMSAGGKLVLMRRWDPEQAMQLIEREKVTSTGGVPTIAWQLAEHPARSKYDLSSLGAVSYGGAPAAPELVRTLAKAFPGSLPGTGWGMTETTGTFTIHVGREYANRPESAGPAAPVGEMQVRDPGDGQTILASGRIGELWVKGPQIVKGYWNKPEATAETFQEGWLRTGDLVKVDTEGFLFIVDRAKDMLIRGGENIYCVEVENALFDHPDVIDAAVVGIPHRTLGEEPAAVVHLRPTAATTEAELREYVRERLAAFKVPVKVAFWPEPLPRNANGKIVKTQLKALFAAEALTTEARSP